MTDGTTPVPEALTAEEECDHRDEHGGPGTAIMFVRDDRYECAVCGKRFRLVPADAARSGSQADPETTARRFHEAYERLAPSFGYETRRESAVPWEDVPEANRRLMIAVASEVMGSGSQAVAGDRVRTALHRIANWQTHGPLQQRDAVAMADLARAALTESGAAEPPVVDGLDAERLARAMVSLDTDDPGVFNIVAISEPDTRPVAQMLAAEYARLGAATNPGEAE
jgi:hypothetical protein